MRSCLIVGNQTLAGPALASAIAERLAPGEPIRFHDEVILSTLPPGISRWLGQDAPSRLKAALSVPVVVVSADPAPVPSESG